MTKQRSSRRRIQLRKYPNRRYYDITRSQHATLKEIYQLVLDNFEVEVTDSKTGEDITAKVLAQIILEHDPPKMGVFPAELLHQVIRANEPLVRDFISKYFNQALSAFLESQRQFDRYLREAFGLEAGIGAGVDWSRMMFGPLAAPYFSNGGGGSSAGQSAAKSTETSTAAERETTHLREQIDELRDQVKILQQQLDQRQSPPLGE